MLKEAEENLMKYLKQVKDMNQFDFVFMVGNSHSYATWEAMQAVATNALRIIDGKKPPNIGNGIHGYFENTDDGTREPLPHP